MNRASTLLIFIVFLTQCGGHKAADLKQKQQSGTNKPQISEDVSLIDEETAILIAKNDVLGRKRSLDEYNIFSCEQRRLWRVIFEPKTRDMDGLEYAVVKLGGWIASSEKYAFTRNIKDNKRVAAIQSSKPISRELAIEITRKDAVTNNEPPEAYDIVICELTEAWRIIFDPKDNSEGGGPEFIVDKQTGEIVHKMYFQ